MSQVSTQNDIDTQNARDACVLVDKFGRVHRSLRISVTDVCNIRCQYCMPEENATFLSPSNLLSFDQIEAFVRAIVPLGIRNFRLTGGEPLLRPKICELVERLAKLAGVDDLALTTNGMLLAPQVNDLVKAGLRRVNISLDTLSESTFRRISRREGLSKTIQGIEAAADHPDLTVKLNALILRDINLSEVVDLVDFASARGLQLRFIEFMPLDAERAWTEQRMVSGSELRELLSAKLGALTEIQRADSSRPSREFTFAGGRSGTVGFIDSVSTPFCEGCDRLRLTADGKIQNCLFGKEDWDVSELLASEDSIDLLTSTLRQAVLAKHAAHGIADPDFRPPHRAMYQIGG